MSKQPWHDINRMSSFSASKKEAPPPAQEIELTMEPVNKKEQKETVKLIDATWKPGKNGFKFNEECILEVRGSFITSTSRRKISAKTFVVYNNENEDIQYTGEGFLNDECVAEVKIKLFYGEKFYNVFKNDSEEKCNYKCIVSHPEAKNDLESPLLEMPKDADMPSLIIELEIDPEDVAATDDAYTLFSADPGKSYSKTLTVKDDTVQGDDMVSLRFEKIKPDLTYSLEIDPGADGAKYLMFENIPYSELSGEGVQ